MVPIDSMRPHTVLESVIVRGLDGIALYCISIGNAYNLPVTSGQAQCDDPHSITKIAVWVLTFPLQSSPWLTLQGFLNLMIVNGIDRVNTVMVLVVQV